MAEKEGGAAVVHDTIDDSFADGKDVVGEREEASRAAGPVVVGDTDWGRKR